MYPGKVYTITLIALTIILTGCFSARKEDINAFLKPHEADVTLDDYIIQAPDEVTVVAPDNIPELRSASRGSSVGQTQIVRPDGVISFENIGEIPVVGKTPREVAKLLEQKLSHLYKFDSEHPIDVRVSNQSKFYYIIGMVRRPGTQIFTGRETTLSAITRAIPITYAWLEKVQVIRPSKEPGGRSHVFALNYKDMVERGKMEQNVLLEEGDIIYVPPTILASIGLTIGEITGPILEGASAVTIFTGSP